MTTPEAMIDKPGRFARLIEIMTISENDNVYSRVSSKSCSASWSVNSLALKIRTFDAKQRAMLRVLGVRQKSRMWRA